MDRKSEKIIEVDYLFNGFKHKDYVFYLDIWSDVIVSGSADNTISVCRWKENKVVTNIAFDYKGRWGIPVSFSKNGAFLAVGAYEEIVVYDVNNSFRVYSRVFGHRSGVQSLFISKDHFILTGGSDGRLVLWSFPDLSLKKEVSTGIKEVWSVSISKDEKFALCGGSEKLVCLYNFPDLKLKKMIKNDYPVEFVDFSPDSSFFLFADAGGKVVVFDMNNLDKPARVLSAHIDSVLVARFLDEDVVVSGGRDGDIYFFSLNTGNVLKKISAGSSVFSIDFSIDNSLLVAGNEKGDILFYKVLVQ
ncbi:MAG: WD40 repeat domain-containing protein [Brevinematia bacterium]